MSTRKGAPPVSNPREVLIRHSKRTPTGCLEWQRAKNKRGYGRLTVNNRRWLAHRLAYETFRGPIPEGLVLDHLVCDNPACIDWWHTEPTTDYENTTRSPLANVRKTHCKHGHEFTPENTLFDARGHRHCRECRRGYERRRRASS